MYVCPHWSLLWHELLACSGSGEQLQTSHGLTRCSDSVTELQKWKRKKKKRERIASKKVKKADRRDKDKEGGRKEEEKGKTGCVRRTYTFLLQSLLELYVVFMLIEHTICRGGAPRHVLWHHKYHSAPHFSEGRCDTKARSFGARTRLKKMLENPSRILPAPLRTSRSHTMAWTDRFMTAAADMSPERPPVAGLALPELLH